MHSNLWNIKCSKELLRIKETTLAQKRHIQSILTAKTTLPQSRISPFLSPDTNDGQPIVAPYANRASYDHGRSSSDLQQVSRNLKIYSSVNRTIKAKAIE